MGSLYLEILQIESISSVGYNSSKFDALAKSRHRYFLSFSSGLQTILGGIKIDSRANGELAFLSNPDFLAGSDFLRGHQIWFFLN